jgi:cellobiose-specific phosphotransferase system component IIC
MFGFTGKQIAFVLIVAIAAAWIYESFVAAQLASIKLPNQAGTA